MAQFLHDGTYNVRGHIVQIKNGIRVATVSSQSNNQHMRNNSASERLESKSSMNGLHGKNSIYSGREYLLNHLSDLSSGREKGAVEEHTYSSSQRKVDGDKGFDELQTENLTAKEIDRSTPNTQHEADKDSSTGLSHKNGISIQPSVGSISNTDSLEVSKLREDQSNNAELMPKSSLKRQQPPGSPTKEKRKVKFNNSIEFNDGFVWLLKDKEEKSRFKNINAKVSTQSSSTLGEENILIPVPNKTIISNGSDPQNDYSYPETVDLGLPTNSNRGSEDVDKHEAPINQSKENVKGEIDIEQTPDCSLYDSLEVGYDDNEQDGCIGAVQRDSLEFVSDDGDKPDVRMDAKYDSQRGYVQAEPRNKEQSLPLNHPTTNANEIYRRDIFTQERNVEHIANSKRFEGELDSYAPANKGFVNANLNSAASGKTITDISTGFTRPHNNAPRQDFSSHRTYESFHPEKPVYTQNHPHTTSMNSTNGTINRPQKPFVVTSNENQLASPLFATSYANHIDTEIGMNSTASEYHYLASKKPTNSEYGDGGFNLVQDNGIAITNTGHPSYVPNRHFTGHTRELQSDATLNSRTELLQRNYDAANFYSSMKTSMPQDRRSALNEEQSFNGNFHTRIPEANDISTLLHNQSEALQNHAENPRNRFNAPKHQQKVLRDEASMPQTQLNKEKFFLIGNDAVSTQLSTVQSTSRILHGSDFASKDDWSIENEQSLMQNPSGNPSEKDTSFMKQNKLTTVESNDEDDVIRRVRKSMAELQFNSNWRPESAATMNRDYGAVSEAATVEEIPRPSNKTKAMHAELVEEEDKIKMQSKLTETSGKQSNIPIRVQSAPTTMVRTQQKVGIVPHPPKGPKGLFTRKISRQGTNNRRNSPMRVIKPRANGNQRAAQDVENLLLSNRLFSTESSVASRMHNGKKGMGRAENRDVVMQRNYHEDLRNAALQGDIHKTEKSVDNDLNKTPTDDEINELWFNVRNCLTAKPPAKASSDSYYIAPPWRQNRTWSGTTRGHSNANRQFSLNRASNTQRYPLRRYGSQDNLITRENSFENVVENSNPRVKSALLTQRSNKAKISSNLQAFTTKSSSTHRPYRSEKTPDVSKAKSNDSKF